MIGHLPFQPSLHSCLAATTTAAPLCCLASIFKCLFSQLSPPRSSLDLLFTSVLFVHRVCSLLSLSLSTGATDMWRPPYMNQARLGASEERRNDAKCETRRATLACCLGGSSCALMCLKERVCLLGACNSVRFGRPCGSSSPSV